MNSSQRSAANEAGFRQGCRLLKARGAGFGDPPGGCGQPLGGSSLAFGFFHPPRQYHGAGDCHLSAYDFEALSFRSERPFAVQRFQDFLERLPDNVYRGKGLLWIAESDKP
jgi:G3E family GTPase